MMRSYSQHIIYRNTKVVNTNTKTKIHCVTNLTFEAERMEILSKSPKSWSRAFTGLWQDCLPANININIAIYLANYKYKYKYKYEYTESVESSTHPHALHWAACFL